MSEKLIADTAIKTADATRRRLETMVRKAWSIMDAASEKRRPTEYLSGQGVRSMQGKE